jgi:Cu(I)/Ag(I) efflux system periplasmic protein CusF
MKSLTLSLLFAAACGHVLAADSTELSEGEIRKVDKGAAKLTIKHGELKNLDMPAMTMVFQVKDKAWLDKLKAGDKVRFKVEKLGSDYVVTTIEPKAN